VVAVARAAGEEYLLDRGLSMFSYPTRWYYDVLRGLEYFPLHRVAR